MQNDKEVLRNSWKTPCIDPVQDEWRFTKKYLLWKLVPWYRVPEKKLAHLKHRLLARFAMVATNEEEYQAYAAALDISWPQMKEKFRKNPALYQFMMEYGVHSEFFYPFLMRVPNATTLEVVGGKCFDMLGRLREIPRTDALYQFIYSDEMFRWIVTRMEVEGKYLRDARRVFFLGGGLLQSLRYNNYKPRFPGQEVVAYDLNTDLKPELDKLYAIAPVRSATAATKYRNRLLDGVNIEYYFQPATRAFDKPDYQGYFDLVDASGVFSYRENLDELRGMLRGALRILRPGGILLFDLQVLRKVLLFDKFILDWNSQPSMKPEKNVQAAIQMVNQLCNELGVMVEVVAQEPIGVQFAVYAPSAN